MRYSQVLQLMILAAVKAIAYTLNKTVFPKSLWLFCLSREQRHWIVIDIHRTLSEVIYYEMIQLKNAAKEKKRIEKMKIIRSKNERTYEITKIFTYLLKESCLFFI